MKKFYAFAAAAFAALSMNAADLYVVGNGEGLDWTPETPYVVTPAADGTYSFAINSLASMKISTVMGDWDTFNGSSLYVDGTIENDKALTLVAGSAEDNKNIDTPWVGDYTVTIAADLSTITLHTDTPEPVGFTKVYVVGEFTNTWNFEEDWMMSTEDGVTYTFSATGDHKIPVSEQGFKIADTTWTKVNYSAAGPVTVDEECPWFWDNSTNSNVTEEFEGTITIVLPEEKTDEATVTFRTTGSVFAIEAVQGEVEYFNLQGVRVANPENGMYIVRQGSKVTKQVIR